MVLDDVHLPSVRNLFLFLKKEKNWQLETIIEHTAFFIKTSEEVIIDDWQNQGINQNFKKVESFKNYIKSLIKQFLRIK